MYEVRIPEELAPPTTSYHLPPPAMTGQKSGGPSSQKLVEGGGSQLIEESTVSESPKTSLKTTTNDDERFAEFVSILEATERELTGKCARGDSARWADVARLLSEELKQSESKTSISSVPAFLAEHLRRRLRKEVKGKREGKRVPAIEAPQQPEQDPDRRLTSEEISSFAATVTDLLKDGATLEEVTAQFAGSLHPEDWTAIRETATALVEQ